MVFIATHSHDTSGLSPHYFIYPFLAFCLFAYSYLLRKKPYLLVILIPLTIVQFTLSADLRPLDVITGWDYPQQQHVAALISQNCPPNFNIATTLQDDTRSYDLRVLLAASHCLPLPVEQYPTAQTLFLVAPNNRPPATESVWEVSSFRPFKITATYPINSHISLYRLDH